MKSFRHKYDWTIREEWFLPDEEEMMQGQFPILDEQIDCVLNTTRKYLHSRVGLGECAQRTCVQAGGAFGMYPLRLSHHFQHVVTFEPLLANLQCMAVNLGDLSNVTVEEYPLWDEADVDLRMDYTIRRKKNSYGAHHVSYPHQAPRHAQRVTTVTLDQYRLEDVDLIWLDIEGAEFRALKGACWTISKYKPVIVLEDRQFSQMRQYGVNKGDAIRWLRKAWDYKVVGKTAADTILVPN